MRTNDSHRFRPKCVVSFPIRASSGETRTRFATYNQIMDQNERANDETLTDFKPINPSVNIDRIRTPDHEHAHPDIVEIAEINHVAAN